MVRVLLTLLAAAACSMALGGTFASASGPAGSSCVYKWKKKVVVKKVHRNGKVKRVRKVRHYRVCVPVKPPVVDPARLGVRAFEYGLTLSRQTLTPGDTIVELDNIGEDAHDLHITRVDDGTDVAIPETPASGISQVRFDTSPGTYRLFCSLPTHAARGMDATIEVVAP